MLTRATKLIGRNWCNHLARGFGGGGGGPPSDYHPAFPSNKDPLHQVEFENLVIDKRNKMQYGNHRKVLRDQQYNAPENNQMEVEDGHHVKPEHDEHDDHHDDHHHDAHHGHHGHHSSKLVPDKYYEERPVYRLTGRRDWIDLTMGNQIPHDDPANPGYDISDKRKNYMVGTKQNPRRHIYMFHTPQTQYDDHFMLGDLPVPDIVAEKEPCRKYKHQAVARAFEYLSNNVNGFSLNAEDWDEVRNTSWQLHGIDNINEIKFAIFDHLADSIVVKESKFRPRVEQRQRRAFARQQLAAICYAGRSLDEFFNDYNTIIWLTKEQSNMFRAPEIPGDYSAIEEETRRKDHIVGIRDLESDSGHNNNFINSFMRALHK